MESNNGNKVASVTPSVGMGITVCGWSDRNAGTIVRVSPSGKTIWAQLDNQELLNGINSGEPDALKMDPGGFVGHVSGQQRWKCTPNPAASIGQIRRRKDGSWKDVGGGRVLVGVRNPHYDFNF